MENNVPVSFKAGNSVNLPSAKKMGTLYFTEDRKIYFDIDDTTRLTMSDMDAIPGELKDDGSIYFDDKVYVGGELDDTGNWDPTPVESQSSLHVSGTTHLNEHLYVSEGATIDGHLDVGSGDKSRGLYVNGSGEITGSLDIGNDLRVTGATAINGTLTAKEVKTTSKITAGGSIEANNQIRFKPNTNRDEKVKLSDVINEALDFTFKNRIGIDGADVTSAIEGSSDTFTLRLQEAIKLMENSWSTGITVAIPSGSYEYNDTAMISYYGSLLIKGVGKIPSTISFINNNSTIFDLYSGESGSLSLSHLDIIGNGCNLINPNDSEDYASWDDIILQDCNISNCKITLFGGNKIIIDNCTLTNVSFEGEVDRLLVSNSTFTSNTFTNLTVNVYQNFDKCNDNLFVDENGKIHGSILSADSAIRASQDFNGNVITAMYETKVDATSKLTEAKTYADQVANTVKNDLLNNAGTAYDTLKELGDLIDENKNAIDVLIEVAAHKANAIHTHKVTDISDLSVTATELNYMDGVTSNVQTQLNGKASFDTATTTTAGLMSAIDKAKLDGIATGANKITIDSALSSTSLNPVQNKVVNTAITNLNSLIGNTSVATQISDAMDEAIVGLSASGKTITYTKGDGTTGTITTSNTDGSYSDMIGATASTAGKAGLVPAPAAGKQSSFLRGDGVWAVPTDTTYGVATQSANGLMSIADKKKLDGIAEGANNYTYTLPTASSSTLGGVKTTSTVTSTSGLTACPIIGGVPYYKDTNNTYNLSSFGITATATELNKMDGVTATTAQINYLNGVTSSIQTQLNGKSNTDHTHNYAGSASVGGAATSANKVNNSLTIKLNSGTTEGTNLFTFNGSTAKSINITPSAIGALSTTGGNVTGDIILDNDIALRGKDAGGTSRNLIYLGSSNKLHIGYGFGNDNLEKTHSVQLNGKILLTSKTYGKAFPTEGLVAGRVFFKKVSG